MKTIFFLIAFFALSGAKAQFAEHLSSTTTIGTGIALSTPKSTPVSWQFLEHYNFNKRLAVGIGAGLSFYEKTLIPLFADLKFNLIQPKKLTPYLSGSIGYSFAASKTANGGFYLHPSLGIQYAYKKQKFLFALGYESQKLQRLKKYENPYLIAEFKEQLCHNSITFKIGFIF